MTESKPVILERAHGAQYGFASAEKALAHFPDGKIVGYQDGSPYEAPEAGNDGPNLKAMKRDDLNAYAIKAGVENPDDLDNKDAVLEAIAAAQAATLTGDESGDGDTDH